MGVIKRQGSKASLVAYLGVVFGAVNTLWLYPKFLNPEEIGLLSLLTNLALIIAPLAQMGVNGIILKYYPKVKGNEEQLGAFIYLCLLISSLGFLFSMLLLYICRNMLIDNFIDTSPLIVDYLFLLVPFTFIIVGRNMADTFSRAELRITMPKLYKEVILRILIFAVVILYSFYHLETTFLVLGFVAAFGINLILMLFYVRRLDFIQFRFSLKYLDPKMMRESLIYGAYVILSGFAGMIVTKIDSWMISSELNLESNGIYTIALFIGLAIEMPKRSMNLISLPIVGKAMSDNRLDVVKDLYAKSAIIQLVIGSLLFICVWINIESLFMLIPNSETFITGKYVVFFIGLAVLFDMATGINNEIILMSDFYKWNIFIMLFLIGIAIANNFLLIPIYGITGAAIATAVSIFLFNIIKYLLVWKKLGIQPFSINNLYSLLISLALFALGMNLPSTPWPFVDIAYKSTLIIGLFVPVHYFLKISPDLNSLVLKGLSKLKKN
jgi:O-antigen/teichoic acid export membrane protein